MHTIVLGYAGGTAALAALPWLRNTYGVQVVTVTVDLGQERDLASVRDRALAAGAARAHVVDRREAFARDFVLPALKADAALAPASWADVAWPLIAQALVDVAAIEQATAVAHGCAPGSAEASQLETAVRALGPDLLVVAAGAARHNTSLASRASAHGPDEAAVVDLAFARGVPTALNGIEMSLDELFSSLNTIASAYGASRPAVEDPRASEALVENLPAIVVLQSAHEALRRLVTDPRLNELCDIVGREYASMIAEGLWFSPMRRAIDAFSDQVQARVTGAVRLKLFAGGIERVSVASPFTRPAAARRVEDIRSIEGQSVAL